MGIAAKADETDWQVWKVDGVEYVEVEDACKFYKYVPKKGDVVIGKIKDVRFSMWDVDINSPYSGILPAFEVFGREKKELNKVYDVGDVLFLRVVDVDEIKKAKYDMSKIHFFSILFSNI